MSKIEERIKELGLELPPCPTPVAAYIPAVVSGNLIYASGQTPTVDGKLMYKGKVGKDLTIEEGYEAAKIAVLRCISEVASVADLDHVKMVKLNGYVNSEGDFGAQPKVMNGASETLVAIFGDNGRHARAALGVSTLPDNAAVEVELIMQII